ncbi:MAG: ATP-binding protein [Candidatus Kapaibacterium sp.]
MTKSKVLINDIKCIIDESLLDEDSTNMFKNCLSKVVKHFDILEFQIARLTRDKSIIHNLLTKTSSELTTSLEISEKKSKEIASILSSTPAMIYVKDKDSNFEIVNNELRNNFNIQSESVKINDYLYEHTLFNDLKNYEIDAISSKTNIDKLELHYVDKYYRVNLSPLIDDDNEVIGIVGVIWDISKLMEKEKQLEIKIVEASQANKAKDQFLANISHEIRTPMSAIMGLSEQLLTNNTDSETYNSALKIHNSSINLLHIINDILDFSKLESGTFSIESEDFLLEDLIESVVNNCDSKLQNKDIELLVDIDSNIPFELNGGYYRLIQVLTNLLSNAIKFTDTGKVELIIELNKVIEDDIIIRFKVIDTGIGMSDDQLDMLFRPFSQIDYSNTRKYGGTGLGLAISKQLINEMGGEISCYSELNKGSSFIFSIALKKSPEIDTKIEDYSIKSGKKDILIVSPNIDFISNTQKIVELFKGLDNLSN